MASWTSGRTRVANVLVGNPDDAATLECTLTGPTLRFMRERLIALSGADFQARIDDMLVRLNQPLLVRGGATLRLRRTPAGRAGVPGRAGRFRRTCRDGQPQHLPARRLRRFPGPRAGAG